MYESSSKNILIRVTPSEKQKYSKMAEMRGYTLTDLVKRLLENENDRCEVYSSYFCRKRPESI